MRLSILPILLTGVSVASLVAAEPIRVIEVPSNANANIRLGHSLANANVNGNDDNVARIIRPAVVMSISPQSNNKGLFRHFCGTSLREKALRMSNAFRQALGMPLIKADVAVPGPGEFHILPMPYSPNIVLHPQEQLDKDGKSTEHHDYHHPDHLDEEEHEPHHHGHHRHYHGHHHDHHEHHRSFLRRIYMAIRALGPWEGRAVAFVLGCGIGVLLRMFWVLTVLACRTVSGERGEETFDREYIVYEHVPEALFDTPPEYVDEKARAETHQEVEERK